VVKNFTVNSFDPDLLVSCGRGKKELVTVKEEKGVTL